ELDRGIAALRAGHGGERGNLRSRRQAGGHDSGGARRDARAGFRGQGAGHPQRRGVLPETESEDDFGGRLRSVEGDAYDRLMTQPAELLAAGVKIAFGSFDNSFSRRLGQQAANAVAHGMAYDDALKAVTLYPAQILGLDGELGTLETGKIANLIVTDGDPLELTTEVRFLFIKGQLTPT